MKSSDSTTSLSGLVVCDTGCFQCSEGNDIEGGDLLIDSRDFLSCKCRFATHRSCWRNAMELYEVTRCPMCNEGIQTKIPGVVVVPSAEDDQKPVTKTQVIQIATAFVAFIVVFLLLIFIIMRL